MPIFCGKMIAKNIGQKLRWDYCIVAGLSRSLVYMFGLSMRPFLCFTAEKRRRPRPFLGCTAEKRHRPRPFFCFTAEKRRHPRPFFCFTAEKRRRPRPFFCFTAEMRHRPRPFLGCTAEKRRRPRPFFCFTAEMRVYSWVAGAIERKAQQPYSAYVLGTKSDIYGRLWDRGVFHA